MGAMRPTSSDHQASWPSWTRQASSPSWSPVAAKASAASRNAALAPAGSASAVVTAASSRPLGSVARGREPSQPTGEHVAGHRRLHRPEGVDDGRRQLGLGLRPCIGAGVEQEGDRRGGIAPAPHHRRRPAAHVRRRAGPDVPGQQRPPDRVKRALAARQGRDQGQAPDEGLDLRRVEAQHRGGEVGVERPQVRQQRQRPAPPRRQAGQHLLAHVVGGAARGAPADSSAMAGQPPQPATVAAGTPRSEANAATSSSSNPRSDSSSRASRPATSRRASGRGGAPRPHNTTCPLAGSAATTAASRAAPSEPGGTSWTSSTTRATCWGDRRHTASPTAVA